MSQRPRRPAAFFQVLLSAALCFQSCSSSPGLPHGMRLRPSCACARGGQHAGTHGHPAWSPPNRHASSNPPPPLQPRLAAAVPSSSSPGSSWLVLAVLGSVAADTMPGFTCAPTPGPHSLLQMSWLQKAQGTQSSPRGRTQQDAIRRAATDLLSTLGPLPAVPTRLIS